ncbi:ankyrin unc44 [Colletotrichum sp. SAR 10_66]|nr:ankyrin unc44 [Colletotrichum sp. SAR 10_66]
MSAIATPHLLQLALAQDRCRIQDPGCLVYGLQLQAGKPGEDHPHDDIQFEEAFRRLPRRLLTSSLPSLSRFPKSWITNADRCEESLQAAALPVVLWAALQPPELALNFLAEIEHVDPTHLWAMFLVPSTPCHDHRAWPADFPIRHAMSNALHTAAQYGNTEVVRWLLDREHLASYHRFSITC